MQLDILSNRAGSAADNMATDFLLLRRYPQKHARFRHYGWHRPAFTFGYSQKIDFVRTQLPEDEALDLCRRPTGGGLVDHRDDWTFMLIIPRGHPLEENRAAESYREVHAVLANALRQQNVPAEIKTECDTPDEGQTCGASGVCFQRAERFDVVHSESGEKIAGAAQKRNKDGLLFQGSLWRPSLRANIDMDQLEADFIAGLAQLMQYEAVPTPWPE